MKILNPKTGFLILVLTLAGCGGGKPVDCEIPRREAIRESFTEPAKTRLEDTYLITMPVAGRLGRIELEPGDPVKKGQPLAEVDLVPFERQAAEARAAVQELDAELAVNAYDRLEELVKIQTQSMIEATEEALRAVEAQIATERARSERTDKERQRLEALAEDNSIPQSRLDDARLEAETALIDLRKAQFNYAANKAIQAAVLLGPKFVEDWLARKRLQRSVLEERREQARERLALAEHDLALAQTLVAPINGVVLERYDRGERHLPAGEQLMLLGDLSGLEVVADILTQDALRIGPGSRVWMEPASGFGRIEGRVRRIEPAGFTKLSSLGVEQQRVNAIVSLESRPENLGVGYQLRAEFIVRGREDALTVPRTAVMRDVDGQYFVFAVVNGELTRRDVELGLQGDLRMEIVSGLSGSEAVAVHPDATMTEGMSVEPAVR